MDDVHLMPVEDYDDPVPANTTTPEPKVVAATTGAGAGAVVANFLLWVLDVYVLTPGQEGDIPGSVTLFVTLAVSAGAAFVAGYMARHQYRSLPPDPESP